MAESILPLKCVSKDFNKMTLRNILIIIKHRLIIDYTLKEFNDLEKLKNIFFDSNQ